MHIFLLTQIRAAQTGAGEKVGTVPRLSLSRLKISDHIDTGRSVLTFAGGGPSSSDREEKLDVSLPSFSLTKL